MNTYMNNLHWLDHDVLHRLWIEGQSDNTTRLCMKIIKDSEPEMLYLSLKSSQEAILSAWSGHAIPVTDAYDDGQIYSQVRSLLNLSDGCVLWSLTHVVLPNGDKTSTDKIGFIPGMREWGGQLIPI